MQMSVEFWETARLAAARAALEAWKEIKPLYEGQCAVRMKEDQSLATEADQLADEIIIETLRKQFAVPEFGYLTEESEDSFVRLDAKRVWIIDPIDGTRDFIKRNGNFAMHIGLVE